MTRVEALENIGRTFDNTLAFVTDPRVSSVPIDVKVYTPQKHSITAQAQWERNWEIAGAYLGTDKSLEEIGREHGITREYVRQIVKKCVGQLHQIQNRDVKSEFPLDQFSYHKPLSISSRRKRSEARGGTAAKIERAFLEGKTISQINKEIGSQYVDRRRLREWGIEVPYMKRPILPRFEKLRDPELPDEEKQKLLDSVRYPSKKIFTYSGEETLVMSVSRVGREAGLFFNNDKVNVVYALLRSKGIPVSSFSYDIKPHGEKRGKRLTYYFIAASDRNRAIEIIKNSKEFDQFRVNPVTVLGKPTARMPNVQELMKSGNYARLSSLIFEIRGKTVGVKTEDIILDDCPVSVFRYIKKGGAFYSLDKQKQLRKYLMKRLSELGKL